MSVLHGADDRPPSSPSDLLRFGVLQGASGPLPEFGATRGQDISKGILGIEASFEGQIDKLRRLDYDILDVKTSRWHDDYNVFKNAVKDLEVRNGGGGGGGGSC
jgi:hypothetical protein